MNVREKIEKWEKENLSSFATLSTSTKGRDRKERECSLRTEFQKDRDKILHSLSFRLLKHKTQVFLSTSGEDFRTRLTHTLEVASIARYIARALNLNQDLVEAIALGHDLGHTPFGHIGEEVLDELASFKFEHSQQGVRVVELIENNGCGLNLTCEVKDGIRQHSKGTSSIASIHDESADGACRASTVEGEVVQFADWFAYINHDIDDAFNMSLISKKDLPDSTKKVLGFNFEQRLVTMLRDVIDASNGSEHIQMSSGVMKATDELRQFLYDYVYKLPRVAKREATAREVISYLFRHYIENYDLVIKEMPYLKNELPERGVCDFIAFLTDVKAQERGEKVKVESGKKY